MEFLTVVLYLLDVFFRTKNLWQLQDQDWDEMNDKKDDDQILIDEKDQFIKRKTKLKIEIVTSLVAVVPFSLIFQLAQQHEPVLLVDFLCLLRIVKIMPILKLFEYLKSENMQKWRVIEVVITYYFICHIITGVWISMGVAADDVRETWLRRIPVP